MPFTLGSPVFKKVAPKKVIVGSRSPIVILPCKACAYPEAKVSWSRRGAQLPANAVNGSDGSLIITDFSEQDEGIYVCRAENEHGYVEHASRVSLYHGNGFLTRSGLICIWNFYFRHSSRDRSGKQYGSHDQLHGVFAQFFKIF